MTIARYVTAEGLRGLSAEAAAAPRRRKNLNLHDMADPVHRLLNALEPGTYIRPHRHAAPPKAETMIGVAGRIGIVFFDEDGAVLETAALSPQGPTIGVDIAPGLFHSLVALEPGSVFFECKPGPYVPPVGADAAPWAPGEGGEEAAAFEARLRALFD